MKNLMHVKHGGIYWILSFILGLSACKDSISEEGNIPYDPSLPVAITGFTPDSGAVKTQMGIEGENFGTDTSLVKVFIGGKKAVLISAKSNFIYCMVPAKSYEGTVSVTVGDQTATASEKFHYNREMMVSTLYGKVRDDGKYDVVDGAFDESFINYYGVQEPTWFSFNPNDSTELYMSQDNGKPIRIFDLDEKVVRTGLTTGEAGIGRMRTLSWTADGDTLIVASDDGGGGDNDKDRKSAIYVTKNGNGEFRNAGVLAAGRQCNGVAIHPVNHEMYYNNFSKGVLYRFDYHKWGVGPENCMAHREYITTIQDNEWEFNIVIHPSGDYAYLVVINRHYIMRMNYDKAKKTFGVPYLIAGGVGQSAWVDGVGANARLNSPYQGVFVKNPEYVKANKSDVYDFYFTDSGNHCVRVLTPEGVVTTYAGRGSANLNNEARGYVDGTLRGEARFNNPRGLAYDEQNNVFYVGDMDNHIIRKIAMEDEDSAHESDEEEISAENTVSNK